MERILGAFETVDFPDFGLRELQAKVDTGALTSSLDCRMTRVVQDETGANILEFQIEGHKDIERTTDFFVKWVRSSNGAKTDRYFVNTTIAIGGERLPILLSLADRTQMKVPVLLGRRFLRDHNFLVDSRQDNR